MKRTRHTPEQVINKLREAETMLAGGRTVAQVLQHLGVSEATFNRWRNQYGGMKSEDAKRLKELEIENARWMGPRRRKLLSPIQDACVRTGRAWAL